MNNQQHPFIYREMPIEPSRGLQGGMTVVNGGTGSEADLKKIKPTKKITHVIKKAINRKQYNENKKATSRKSKFNNWVMPPAPQQFLKSKNNDPL